jgi:hypothetical protein
MAEMIPQSINANSEATPGEKKVFQILQDALIPDEDYLVWHEPKVIDRYTDFIAFSQKFGLLIIEVKDFLISQINEFNPQIFKGNFYGSEKSIPNPLVQAREVANRIKGLIQKIPSLLNQEGEHINQLKFPIGHCVIFTKISRKQAEEKNIISCLGNNQALFSDDLSFDVDDREHRREFIARLKQTFLIKFSFTPLSYNELNYLRFAIFPEVRVNVNKIRKIRTEKDEELLKTLDLEQEKTSKSLGEGHRILKGVAGSGKTLVLACRVKYLKQLHPDWKILVVCYNISLRQYLRKLIDVSGSSISFTDDIDIFHFHGLVKQLTNADLSRQANESSDDYDLRIGKILSGRIAEGIIKKGIYDAILIDEGQDFITEWMYGLFQLLNENTDGLLFCYDPEQNVFGRKKPIWAQSGFKVRGKKPTELKKSYRNTVEILQVATKFKKIENKILSPDDDILDINLFPEIATDRHGELPNIKLCNSDSEIVIFILNEIENLVNTEVCSLSDIGILYTNRIGFPELLEQNFINKFGQHKLYWATRDRDSKLNLDISSQSVKLLTVESCKGLEFRIIFFVGLDEMPKVDRKEEAERSLAYVGMTRAQDLLFILAKSNSGYVQEVVNIINEISSIN